MSIKLKAAENIPGWMTSEELKWLAKQAQKHINIVEIGSFVGRSTRALGDNTLGRVFAVDDFVGPRDISDKLREDYFESFVTNLKDLIDQETVIPVLASHSDFKVAFMPDMVFIDGSHEYKDVKRDVSAWLNRLAPGGLLCGHDYTNIVAVRQAVGELLPRHKVAKGTSIWYAKT